VLKDTHKHGAQANLLGGPTLSSRSWPLTMGHPCWQHGPRTTTKTARGWATKDAWINRDGRWRWRKW
jgi:hypothetical protein